MQKLIKLSRKFTKKVTLKNPLKVSLLKKSTLHTPLNTPIKILAFLKKNVLPTHPHKINSSIITYIQELLKIQATTIQ